MSEPFYMPAEWEPHRAVWLAWPSHKELWQENLEPVQDEFVRFCQLVADLDGAAQPRGEHLEILVPDGLALAQAELRLKTLRATFHVIPFGDIWLRDTSAVFLKNSLGQKVYARARFNGWGGKYNLPHDDEVALRIGSQSGFSGRETSWVLEGGAIEVDGEGTCLTSQQCLLNPNRNLGKTPQEIEAFLKDWLGVQKVLWVDQGLRNDHTDGHIDTIARFVAPGVVMCMEAATPEDPNKKVLDDIAKSLEAMIDARGRKLKVLRIPSPGAVLSREGEVMPASYLNFYIGNSTVVVPTYQSSRDDEAVSKIAQAFPTRRTVGASALGILSGGGAFHCMSQQEPI
jgi:agmatine deiminase